MRADRVMSSQEWRRLTVETTGERRKELLTGDVLIVCYTAIRTMAPKMDMLDGSLSFPVSASV